MREENGILVLPEWLVTNVLEPPKKYWGIRVFGNRIHRVAPIQELREEFPNDKMINATGQALTPGFVNTHTHMYGILAHGIPLHKAPADFWGFLADFWWPLIEDRLDSEMINAATVLRCAHMIQSGVTSFYDCTEAPNALPGCLQSQAEIVQGFGLRAILSFEATQRVSEQNGNLGLVENVEFIRSCQQKLANDPGYLIQGLVCHHTLFTCSPQFIRKAYELAQAHHVMLHAHVAEGNFEPQYSMEKFAKRTLGIYKDLGVANERFLASQCVQIDESEVDIIAEAGVRVAHMPLSNCEVGGGIAPIPQLAAKQVKIGLGSDGYIDDFYEIMRGAFLIHKAAHRDPRVMPAQQVWYMATEGGAKVLGFDCLGRLEEGWLADLQLIDANLPTPVETHNFYEQMLLYRNKTHTRAVMINGEFRMLDDLIPGYDPEKSTSDVHQQANRLWSVAK